MDDFVVLTDKGEAVAEAIRRFDRVSLTPTGRKAAASAFASGGPARSVYGRLDLTAADGYGYDRDEFGWDDARGADY